MSEEKKHHNKNSEVSSQQEGALPSSKKRPRNYKRIFIAGVVLLTIYLGLNWYNSPTNYLLRMTLVEILNDDARYSRPAAYQKMAEKFGEEAYQEKMKQAVESKGMSADLTVAELFDTHPQITNFAVREVEMEDYVDGKRVPVTVVSITFYEKNRYVFRRLEFSMYKPGFLPIPLYYKMVSSTGIYSYKDEEGERHIQRGAVPFMMMVKFYNDDFDTKGFQSPPLGYE